MELLRRDAQKGYFSNVLSLPRAYVSDMQIESALTYDLGDKGDYKAWSVDRDHFHVPRNYILTSSLGALPYPVVDARIRSFPRVTFQSKVVLDFKNPALTIQRDGSAALLAVNDGVLCLRCGGGKTVTAIDTLQRLHTPAIIFINDLYLAKQWLEEILEFTDLKKDEVGWIGDGVFDWRHKLTIASVTTVAYRVRDKKLPRELVEHFGASLADECHTTAGAPLFNLAITPFHGRRYGLSATPQREDQFDSLLKYTIGNVVYTYLMPEIKPMVFFRRLQTKLDMLNDDVVRAISTRGGEEHNLRMFGHLSTYEKRTRSVVREVNEAIKQKRNVLVLSQSRAMVERLGQEYPGCEVHGGIQPIEERLRRIRECNPVIIMSRMGRQALNKPILDTLLVLDPNTKLGVLQQLIGRCQRDHPDKQPPIVVFYEDVHIDLMRKMWRKVRQLLNRWPAEQGGALKWQNVGDP